MLLQSIINIYWQNIENFSNGCWSILHSRFISTKIEQNRTNEKNKKYP